jgi:two-component system, cell cycle response regulator
MPQRILIIDDSPQIHSLLEARLKPEDIVLQSALRADEGLQAACADPPDLILLDVEMPEQSGFSLCQVLKADTRTAMVPIIFLTALSTSEEKVRGFELGAVDYITKPFEPAELRARVRAALRTKRYLDLLATRAQMDGLTGIWNRAYFDRRLDEELDANRRYGRPVGLVLIDIDNFKVINDAHGHPFGDRVLQLVALLLGASVRSTDAVCRYGGEEFGVILGETGGDGALCTVERMRQRLERLELSDRGQKVSVTASFGVSSSDWFAPGELTHQGIVDATDAALYAAKRDGRNCSRRWGPRLPGDEEGAVPGAVAETGAVAAGEPAGASA